jgi:protoporphyrin/coproporphyrin ferrochelatase
MSKLLLLISHGTVSNVSELPGFLRAIRRGAEPSPELVAEVTHRYEAIGGKSPLNDIGVELAVRLERKLGVPTRYAARLWNPKVLDVVPEGTTEIAVIALAQYSSDLYAEHVRAAVKERGIVVSSGPNWGSHPGLLAAFAKRIERALERGTAAERTCVLVTAHSLPKFLIDQGDAYQKDFVASVEALQALLPKVPIEHAFQSQGMSAGPGGRPMEWLGPDLKHSFAALKAKGFEHVLVAPIGFLADHVEILYDLDIEAQAMGKEAGILVSRTESLNISDDFVAVLEDLAAQVLARNE